MTKTEQQTREQHTENTESMNQKSHNSSQLMLAVGEHAQEIAQLIDALRKIGYFKSFQTKDNELLSDVKSLEMPKRRLKRGRKAAYRHMKKYTKSVRQYQKERLRRKLCWLLSSKYTQKEIAEALDISVRTVIRDMNRIKPYYYRLSRAYFSRLEQERIKEFDTQLEGKSLIERFKILSRALDAQVTVMQLQNYYKGHYTILHLDMTQTDKYGIPKLTMLPHQTANSTLAYPHKVRVMIKGTYEGQIFEADIGGFNITQKTLW